MPTQNVLYVIKLDIRFLIISFILGITANIEIPTQSYIFCRTEGKLETRAGRSHTFLSSIHLILF